MLNRRREKLGRASCGIGNGALRIGWIATSSYGVYIDAPSSGARAHAPMVSKIAIVAFQSMARSWSGLEIDRRTIWAKRYGRQVASWQGGLTIAVEKKTTASAL